MGSSASIVGDTLKTEQVRELLGGRFGEFQERLHEAADDGEISKEEYENHLACHYERERMDMIKDTASKKSIKGKRGKKISVYTTMCRANLSLLESVIRQLCWVEKTLSTDRTKCDIVWVGQNIDTIRSSENLTGLLPKCRVNRFEKMTELCNKALFTQIIMRMQRWFPEEFNFYPRSYLLPADSKAAAACCKAKNTTLIIKPDVGSEGNGIYLAHRPSDIRRDHRCNRLCLAVAQEYISDTLLLDGFKFDLRLYVLVTSLEPLQIYLYNDGLVRLATQKYEKPTAQNAGCAFMHLTNSTLNKQNKKKYGVGANEEDPKNPTTGSKRRLGELWKLLKSERIDAAVVWEGIKALVSATLVALQPHLVNAQHESYPNDDPAANIPINCARRRFQVLGFDVMLDDKGKPWLLEINGNPSMLTENEEENDEGVLEKVASSVDVAVKEEMLRDALRLVVAGGKGRGGHHGTIDTDEGGEDKVEDEEQGHRKDGWKGECIPTPTEHVQRASLYSFELVADESRILNPELQVFNRARALFEQHTTKNNCTQLSRSQFLSLCRATKVVDALGSAQIDIIFARIVTRAGARGMDLHMFFKAIDEFRSTLNPQQIGLLRPDLRDLLTEFAKILLTEAEGEDGA